MINRINTVQNMVITELNLLHGVNCIFTHSSLIRSYADRSELQRSNGSSRGHGHMSSNPSHSFRFSRVRLFMTILVLVLSWIFQYGNV